MPLTVGSRLGHYNVTALIGEGGMGQVYQATDTKLKRQVALKILPEAFSADPGRLARFQREAEVLASLNHPNIAAIYGLEEADGVRALVLELVEGPTLADRIKRGPIPLDEALPIAKQIAEALEAAHEAGVIHRDLKPANIKVRDDGTVKVLDFGLAKALDPNPEGDPSQSPTLTAAATQMGVIMGTAAYMSPEQARGKPVDKRADIWAFGCVLYEMLTGKRAFEGEDVSVTLADVIRADPTWDLLPDSLPASLRVYLKRCLEKEASQRIQAIGDVRLAIEGAFESTATVALAVPEGTANLRFWQRPVPAMAITVTLIAVGALASSSLTTAPEGRVARFSIPLEGQVYNASLFSQTIALSPDGQKVAYSAASDGERQVFVRSLDQLTAVPVRGTRNAAGVFWSPDGEWIGFHADGQLRKVRREGGTAETLVQTGSGGASWGSDDSIVFGSFLSNTPLMQVSAFGGVPQPVTTLRPEDGDVAHIQPQFLPNGAILFTMFRGSRSAVGVQPTGATDGHIVLLDGSSPSYVPTGHVVFSRARRMWAAPFDLDSLNVTGPETPILEDVLVTAGGFSSYSISGDGSLVYAPTSLGLTLRSLVWLDHDGQAHKTGLPPGAYANVRLSPDGTRVSLIIAVDDTTGLGNPDVWVSEVERNTLSRLTTDPAFDFLGVWQPDGQRIIFSSNRDGGRGLFSKSEDGTGDVEHLTTIEDSTFLRLWGRTIDSDQLLFDYLSPSGSDVALLSVSIPRQSRGL